jgi:CDP-diacylglycerol--serine O-phosphatidyltransferase
MVRRHRQYRYLLPNALTGMGMFLGLWAILLAIDGVGGAGGREALVIAAWWVIVASMTDGLDGKVARMTNTTSNFGVQFDSLADLTTFGIAPAAVLYGVISPWDPAVATGVAATFAIAGAVRLARYNISAAQSAKKRAYQGLPIPAAAGLVMALVLCLPQVEALLGATITHRLIPIVGLIAAYLMISKIRFLGFRDLAFRSVETPVSVAMQVLAFAAFIYWLFFLPQSVLALLVFGGYAVYSVAAGAVWHLRLVRRPWERDEQDEPGEPEARR